ncbi:MAG: hypothetical protein K8L97_06030 [Anaerolineae bacterium]|nr:hypothetical protein [Anaerolineae bacterium]
MNKKHLDTSALANELKGASAFFKQASEPENTTIQKQPPSPPKDTISIPEIPSKSVAQNSAQKVEQPFEQVSRNLSSEIIENLAFRLRKVSKNKVNTEVPIEWKEKLDDLAHELGVGKYELLMYIIGLFLGEVETPEAK